MINYRLLSHDDLDSLYRCFLAAFSDYEVDMQMSREQFQQRITRDGVSLEMSAAAFDAHLMGQGGEKRGLRAGGPALDHAQMHYNRVEWSGRKDRRARKGRIADTEI